MEIGGIRGRSWRGISRSGRTRGLIAKTFFHSRWAKSAIWITSSTASVWGTEKRMHSH